MVVCNLTDATVNTNVELGNRSLRFIAARGVACPNYARSGPPGVVHLGLGAFHRAHQALVFDRLLASGDRRWGVLGVGMRNPALVAALRAQDGLYSVQLASAEGRHWQVSGAVWSSCLATRERHLVVAALTAASTRWVTLTVTEKAYGPDLADLLVEGLAARRRAGLRGLTLASCDNLQGNGRVLQALCCQRAQLRQDDLDAWIDAECAFPNSMVDRIVPAACAVVMQQAQGALGATDNAALRTEAFWEWVIERRFVDDTDASTLAAAGVKVVGSVRPFEDAKLRLLNGSHSAMACIGAVAALPVVSDCVQQPTVRQFVHQLMTCEVGPLQERQDWPDYRDALMARFANPYLQHSVHQIASDSSLKIALRWVPAALDALNAGRSITRLAFCAAAWMRYCLGVDELGQPYPLSDPSAETLLAGARASATNASATFDTLGCLRPVWGDQLPRNSSWRSLVITHLEAIRSHGIIASATPLLDRQH